MISNFPLTLLSILFLLVTAGQQWDQFENIFILLISGSLVCIKCEHPWTLAGIVVDVLRGRVSALKLDHTIIECGNVLVKASSSRSLLSLLAVISWRFRLISPIRLSTWPRLSESRFKYASKLVHTQSSAWHIEHFLGWVRQMVCCSFNNNIRTVNTQRVLCEIIYVPKLSRGVEDRQDAD